MVTPNYGYEKRQKELAKKRKKEEKLKEKAQRKLGGSTGAEDAPDGDAEAPAQDGAAGDSSQP